MRKKFIRELQSLIKYLILFIISKNDKSLRLYVNYKTFNNITIKKNHSLSFISKLQNRF